MFNRVSQRVQAKIGVNEVTQDEEYNSLRATMKGMMEMCKESKKVLSSSIEGNKAWGAAAKAVQKQLENCTTAQADHPVNTHLLSLTEQLGDAMSDFDQKVLGEYQNTLVDDCTAILTQYEAALKTGDALHETRKKRLDTYDYHRNDTIAKAAELEKKGRDQSESDSYQKKKRKEEEAKKEFDKTNAEAKELLTAAVKKRDTVLANYQQAYLRCTANYFGQLHDKFNKLHELTLSPSVSSKPVKKAKEEEKKEEDKVEVKPAAPAPVPAPTPVPAPASTPPPKPPTPEPITKEESTPPPAPQEEQKVEKKEIEVQEQKQHKDPVASAVGSQPSPPLPPGFDSPIVVAEGDGFLEQKW